MSYIDLKYRPRNDVVCDFSVEPVTRFNIEQLAAESSVGTWTELHTTKPYMQKLAAKVFSVRGKDVKVAYPLSLFEPGNIPNLLSSVAGNVFGLGSLKNLRLNDISLPESYVRSFRGPTFGVQGVRKLLRVKKRPLVGTIIKPKLGLRTADHAKVAYDAWVGGCDLVKDDENLSSQAFNPFQKRVIETLKMRDKAERETGERKMYMANITAETNEMIKRAKFVKSHGGEYVMVDMFTCGFSALQTLRDENLGLVIHAHRAMHAAITRNPKHGISMLVFAKLARLAGVDQIHIGTAVGKMEGGRAEVEELETEMEKGIVMPNAKNHVLAQKWYHLKPVLAVCSGGLHPGLVPKLVKMLGNDIVIQMGGGIHWNPRGTKYGAMAARQAVDAVVEGISLKEYAKTHRELKEALDKFR